MKWLVAAALLVAGVARADPPCGVVEVRFQPGAQQLQFVVWIEDASGHVIATPYITRSVGTFGLANRPGDHFLKTSWHEVYGKRDTVFPVWAHRRNHHYPLVVMGGACGNSIASCCSVCGNNEGSGKCGWACQEQSVAYHYQISSTERTYCEPQSVALDGSHAVPIDVMSCASGQNGNFAKGAFADAPAFSLYPPRADLSGKSPTDSNDVNSFAGLNDLVAVSQATPLPNALVSPPVYWAPLDQPEGDYVAWLEIAQQYDFSPGHNETNPDHSCITDQNSDWNFEGHEFLGQPSVIYKVPFHYDGKGTTQIATDFAGYSTWDGSDGTLHPPDGTIVTAVDGSGARRIVDVNDGSDVYRVKVVAGSCSGGVLPDIDGGVPDMAGGGTTTDGGAVINPGCPAPDAPTNLVLTSSALKIDFTFTQPATGVAPAYYAVRYRVGSSPITADVFDEQNPAPTVTPLGPGAMLSGTVDQLKTNTTVAVAVRAVAACGSKSAVVSKVATTERQQFATLHGCFIATAAFGSPMMAEVAALRAFRDRRLLGNPLGQLATAAYYALSPPLAATVSSDENLRRLARHALAPLVRLVAR